MRNFEKYPFLGFLVENYPYFYNSLKNTLFTIEKSNLPLPHHLFLRSPIYFLVLSSSFSFFLHFLFFLFFLLISYCLNNNCLFFCLNPDFFFRSGLISEIYPPLHLSGCIVTTLSPITSIFFHFVQLL